MRIETGRLIVRDAERGDEAALHRVKYDEKNENGSCGDMRVVA